MTTFTDAHLASMLAEQLRELHANLCERLSNASGYEAGEFIAAQARLIDLWREADESGDDTDDECCDDEFPDPIRSALDALHWASGASDFQPGGQAHAGWCEICRPAIAQLEELLEECDECCDDEEPA